MGRWKSEQMKGEGEGREDWCVDLKWYLKRGGNEIDVYFIRVQLRRVQLRDVNFTPAPLANLRFKRNPSVHDSIWLLTHTYEGHIWGLKVDRE